MATAKITIKTIIITTIRTMIIMEEIDKNQIKITRVRAFSLIETNQKNMMMMKKKMIHTEKTIEKIQIYKILLLTTRMTTVLKRFIRLFLRMYFTSSFFLFYSS